MVEAEHCVHRWRRSTQVGRGAGLRVHRGWGSQSSQGGGALSSQVQCCDGPSIPLHKSFLCTENQLKQLDLRFPQNSLEVHRLASALKASPCLVELSLDNAILTRHQDVKLLLQTITGEERPPAPTGDDITRCPLFTAAHNGGCLSSV